MQSEDIDWDQFEGIVDFTDPDCIEIYDEFIEGLRGQLSTLRSVCSSADCAEAARISHRIRGGCLTFGISGLSRILDSLEESALAGGAIESLQWFEESMTKLEAFTHAVDSRKRQLVSA